MPANSLSPRNRKSFLGNKTVAKRAENTRETPTVVKRESILGNKFQPQPLQEGASLLTRPNLWPVWCNSGTNVRYPRDITKGVTATKVDLHTRSTVQRLVSEKNSNFNPDNIAKDNQKQGLVCQHSLPLYSVETVYANNVQQIRIRFVSQQVGTYVRKMGQTLSEPVTKKETSSDENHSFKIGASCMQGWRITMEDEHVYKLCLNDEKETHFFAVFDGHGGQASAQFSAKHLDQCIVNQPTYKHDLAAACKAGFMHLDEQLNKEFCGKEDSSGCTAVSVLVKGNKLYCANAGDSRAVASVRGHAQLLSFDHKPNHEREKRRIHAAGGFVEFNRVNGNLALSRAIGDFVFKKNEHRSMEQQIVVAEPDVIIKDVTKDHEFIVLACDGIWDVLSNQDVVEFVREKLAQRMDPEMICEELMDKCLATECAMGGVGCDNMTVLIIALKQNGSFDELCKKCAVPKRDPIPPSCLLSSYPDYVKGGISCL